MKIPGLIYVVPVKGRAVRDHVTKLIVPEAGMWVDEFNPHYGSFIAMGDLEVREEGPDPAPEPGEAKPAEPAEGEHDHPSAQQ